MNIQQAIAAASDFASFIVPIMIVFYLASGLIVLAINWRTLPGILTYVLADAFSPAAPLGGFAGATVMQGIRYGVARGVFSNESGLGSAAIAAGAARASHPVSQALVSMTQTFIDTSVVCSITDSRFSRPARGRPATRDRC